MPPAHKFFFSLFLSFFLFFSSILRGLWVKCRPRPSPLPLFFFFFKLYNTFNDLLPWEGFWFISALPPTNTPPTPTPSTCLFLIFKLYNTFNTHLSWEGFWFKSAHPCLFFCSFFQLCNTVNVLLTWEGCCFKSAPPTNTPTPGCVLFEIVQYLQCSFNLSGMLVQIHPHPFFVCLFPYLFLIFSLYIFFWIHF